MSRSLGVPDPLLTGLLALAVGRQDAFAIDPPRFASHQAPHRLSSDPWDGFASGRVRDPSGVSAYGLDAGTFDSIRNRVVSRSCR